MTTRIDSILEKIDRLSDELEQEIARRRADFAYRMEGRRARFEAGALARHRALRISLGAFLARAHLMHIVTAPVIYALIVPFALLDLSVSIFQQVCFRAYGIPRVRRGDYIRIDRHHLAYLNALQKLNCVYCGYINGLIAFTREIASRTEAFWCPIKHAAALRQTHARYPQFLDYGQGEGVMDHLDAMRARLRREDDTTPPTT